MKTILALALLALAVPLQAKTYQIDPVHSSVEFKIRHFVSTVKGRYQKFSGTYDYEKGKPGTWKASAEIDAASIDTNMAKRDDHLRSEDFFDAAKCPKITFKSTKAAGAGNAGEITGDLTIRCVTKPVTLKVEFAEELKSGKTGASITGKIDRKDFGVSWNRVAEGVAMLGDEVNIAIELEAAPAK